MRAIKKTATTARMIMYRPERPVPTGVTSIAAWNHRGAEEDVACRGAREVDDGVVDADMADAVVEVAFVGLDELEAGGATVVFGNTLDMLPINPKPTEAGIA